MSKAVEGLDLKPSDMNAYAAFVGILFVLEIAIAGWTSTLCAHCMLLMPRQAALLYAERRLA